MKLHTLEQGQRVHFLASLGGLVVIAGLDDFEPDYLLGSLLSVRAQLARENPERDERLRFLGREALEKRGAEKRAFRAYERGMNVQAFYLSETQIRGLICALGSVAPEPREELHAHLTRLIKELG